MTSNHALSHFFIHADANLAGNVHGGTVLQLVEKAGWVATARHCSSATSAPPSCVTARLDNMSFLKPIHIGDLGHFSARVTYTSPHTMRVLVEVFSEDLRTGKVQLANQASVWFVAMEPPPAPPARRSGSPVRDTVEEDGRWRLASVPQLKPSTPLEVKEFEDGRAAYEARKSERTSAPLEGVADDKTWASLRPCPSDVLPRSVTAATTQLVQLMNVTHSTSSDASVPVSGGVPLKMMDETAGITAAKHCKTNVVTASLDAVDFQVPIYQGNLTYVTGRPVYTSSRSMEVEVVVEVEDRTRGRIPAVRALFTFVSLGPDGKVLPMPPLELQTDSERALFEEGRQRYNQRKELRAKARAAAASGGDAAGAGAGAGAGAVAKK